MRNLFSILLTILLPLASIYGCAHSLSPVPLPENASPAAELGSLQKDLADAKTGQEDVMAHESYSKADQYYQKAKEQLVAGKDRQEILSSIGYARAYLQQAGNQTTLLKGSLQEIVNARNDAISAGAQRFPDALDSADSELQNMADRIRIDSYPSADQVGALQDKYLALELKAIKDKRLSTVRAELSEAEKAGARRYAPISCRIAEMKEGTAEKTIETGRHDLAAIDKAVDQANRHADHCLDILKTAQNYQNLSPEQIAMELNARDHAWQEAENRAEDAQKQQRQIERQRGEMAGIVALNQDLEKARKQFSEDEAEVYRKGDNLIIRLKQMGFTPGKANVPAGALATLDKVKQVISSLQPEKVVIEGHTDANGGPKYNQDLSLKRAESVSKYLKGFDELSMTEMSAVGYGDTKPISTNKTALGRSENRRVDIVLETTAVQ